MRHIGLLFCFCLTACLEVSGQIVVDGMHVPFDRLANTFLVTLPAKDWGKDWQAMVTLEDGTLWQEVEVNGQPVDTLVTFEKVEAGKAYPVTASCGDSLVQATLEFTYLPIFHLQGEFGMEEAPANITLLTPGEVEQGLLAMVKWRGYTTNDSDKHKRNYRVKFVDKKGKKKDLQFFHLRKDNSWILDAGQTDLFRMRNHIAAQLWEDFATKPYYAKEGMEVHTSSRGEIVELFLNDHYAGIFNFCEPVDRKQMQLVKCDTVTGDIHGGLWKAEGWGDTTFWTLDSVCCDNTLPRWADFQLEYPGLDDICPSDYSTLYNAIDFVVNCEDEDFAEQIHEYLDVPVFIDYYIFINLLNAFDLQGKNIFWAVYDKQVDKKLTMAMWDLDTTVGQNYNDLPPHNELTAYDAFPMLPLKIGWQMMCLNPDDFNQKVRDRYFKLREGIFSADSLVARYRSYYDKIHRCGADKREERRWSGDSDIAGLTLDFESEIEYIEDWLRHRLDVIDEFFTNPRTGMRNIRMQPGKDDALYTPLGLRVNEAYKGLVISKNGRKYIRR
ncbi:MAG: CotH kinase family protein [Prevotella sp.]|nr:CotH kinase family protein [Prevotella sp.]